MSVSLGEVGILTIEQIKEMEKAKPIGQDTIDRCKKLANGIKEGKE